MADVLQCRPLIGCMENAQELQYLGGVHYDFTKSQASSCMYFQGQSRRFRVSEEV